MTSRASILDTILAVKKTEVELLAARWSDLGALQAAATTAHQPLRFADRITAAQAPAIIAEVKRASPSKGIIRADLDPTVTAQQFAANGTTCISVLTDSQFFQGSNTALETIRAVLPNTPLLRKDFTISPFQIWEARLIGADAVLLIVAALNDSELRTLGECVLTAGLDLLVEVHTAEELDRAQELYQALGAPVGRFLLGINNRDLHRFSVDLKVTAALIARLQNRDHAPVITESGMKQATDLIELAGYGATGFLIGESLVAAGNPGENLATLIREFRAGKGDGFKGSGQ